MRPTTTLVGLLSVASAAMAMPTLPKEPVAALVAESDTNELATLGFGEITDMFDLPFKIGRTLFKPFTEKKFATPDGRRMSVVELLIERMEREIAEQERLEAEGADGNNPTEPGTEDAPAIEGAPATEGEPATEDGAKNDADIDAFLSIFKGLSEQAPRND
ncbi:hypothetical protein COL154_003941 [Colletotrichum chrysophilum]|uniref:uncharacterized protein n=1 Tax=Colletotrichum chrysophilum TaxID=1836956 RepID=UPI002300EB48|nr:uncharacterized protein COL26b_003278 [Colletotrichum chrysophilum]KAJ0366351.1 hypothetical protein COL154_003941 [Colletotrichum chrysophilum]KAJ0378394.1 hypothetical protein COL26b_003278 [Colletotrichum chrysophilum]